MDGTLATGQDSIHAMEEDGGDGSGVVSLGIGSVMTETLATSQDFYHDTLDLGFGGISSGNGSVMTETLATSQDINHDKGVDGNDGRKHTGDTDLFDDEDKEEDVQDKELPLQEILPGTTFASKTDAVNSVKEFFNSHYHPFVAVRVIMSLKCRQTLNIFSFLFRPVVVVGVKRRMNGIEKEFAMSVRMATRGLTKLLLRDQFNELIILAVQHLSTLTSKWTGRGKLE